MARTLQEVENDIENLSDSDLVKFREWYGYENKYDSDLWDEQMGNDIRAGKLNGLAEKALLEHTQGKTRKL